MHTPRIHFKEELKHFRHPVILLTLAGCLLLVLGGALKWIIASKGILTDNGIPEYKHVKIANRLFTILLGLIGIFITWFSARTKSRFFAIINIIIAVNVLFPLMSAYTPGSESNLNLLGIEGMDIGYYLAVLGWILFMLGTIGSFFIFKNKHLT